MISSIFATIDHDPVRGSDPLNFDVHKVRPNKKQCSRVSNVQIHKCTKFQIGPFKLYSSKLCYSELFFCKTKTKTKTKTEFLKDPKYSIFLTNRGLKDIRYHILSNQPVNFSLVNQTRTDKDS